MLSYLALRVDHAQFKREAATITEYGWPQPATGETVLVVTGWRPEDDRGPANRHKQSRHRVRARCGFSEQNRPPARNALALLADGARQAKQSGRRVWVIEGGPRCGPCFRLARWIEDHHATLNKDYVSSN